MEILRSNEIWTFFYGSNMDLGVLKSVDYRPLRVEAARLSGYDIVIAPLANLVPSDQSCVYGILASGTHEELDRLYGRYGQDKLGATYLPYPVVCETLDARQVSALCYLCPSMEPAATNDVYLDKITGPARDFDFPEWYINRLEAFRPA